MGGDRDAARLLTALGAHMLTGRHGAGAHLVAAPAASEQGRPKEVYRKDYAPPEFLIPAVSLHFTLGVGDESTIVKAALSCERVGSIGAPLVLDGEGLDLLSLCIDGVAVPASGYTISNETNASTTLTIAAAALPVAASFTVETTVEIFPASNHQGDGLYMSAETFVTQCEPQGFRRITFHQDRPDILSVYTVTVDGDTKACPVLLSNGNRVDQGEAEGRHFITFLDPFPKPTYLFALVAGDLGCFQDTFTTMSGRVVQLGIYTEHTNVDRCEFAMKCLKSCMAWDEEQFGLEYDLDLFNIVAVSQFGGAMENKSLNIFSLGLIVATPESTTDAGLESVDAVIAHEYFHNWTGDRVTCRDWFQLTLKEGLTMYRDSRYTADMTAASTKRINDVIGLRNSQFLEDAGGTAHPIRPESYISMSNFYTSTVYSKGQEICRMYEILLGIDGFRKGMDLYFARHDGQAVTCDDFRAAMADANSVADGLAQFEEWYLQSGTPTVKSELSYDETTGRATLRLTQSCPPTPGQPEKRPFLIPVLVGFLDGSTGAEIHPNTLLQLTNSQQDFVFELAVGLAKPPVLSVMRGFSAPVISEVVGQTVDDLAFLTTYDTDSFCRWDASQELATRAVLATLGIASTTGPNDTNPAAAYIAAAAATLQAVADPETSEDLALVAYTLTLPSENVLAEAVKAAGVAVDPTAIHGAREHLRSAIANDNVDLLQQIYRVHRTDYSMPFELTTHAVGARKLSGLALQYLCATDQAQATAEICAEQLRASTNMTDELSALSCLVSMDCPQRQPAIDAFEVKWSQDELVMQSWFSVQAVCPLEGTLARVRELMKHPMWTSKNTNFVRALVGSFRSNFQFHAEDGSGYKFLTDFIIEVDGEQDRMAAGLVSAFNTWRRLDDDRQRLIEGQLKRIVNRPAVSAQVFEMATKILEAPRLGLRALALAEMVGVAS